MGPLTPGFKTPILLWLLLILNPGFSLLQPLLRWLLTTVLALLLQLSLDLRPLPILLLPLTNQFLSLFWWLRFITLDVPDFFLLPVAVRLPGLPVSLKFMVGNIMVVPGMTMPVTGPETIPPSRIHVKIEIWNAPVINPSSVIIMGAIPSPFPGTPPPAAPEKKVHLDIRDNINIRGVG